MLQNNVACWKDLLELQKSSFYFSRYCTGFRTITESLILLDDTEMFWEHLFGSVYTCAFDFRDTCVLDFVNKYRQGQRHKCRQRKRHRHRCRQGQRHKCHQRQRHKCHEKQRIGIAKDKGTDVANVKGTSVSKIKEMDVIFFQAISKTTSVHFKLWKF